MTPGGRHEKVRADWLLAHEAGWHMSDRRMATLLKRRAAQKDRYAAGAAESAHHEGRIKPLASRFVARGEDTKEKTFRRLFLGLVAVPVLVTWLGPALAVAMALYGVATTTMLRLKRAPRAWPWLIGAALVGVGGWFVLEPSGFLSITPWPLAIDFDGPQFLVDYGWMQGTLGLLLTAWQIRRHGWPGVTIKGRTKAAVVPTAPSVPAAPGGSTTAASAPGRGTEVGAAPTLPAASEVFEETEIGDSEALALVGWSTDEHEEVEEHEGIGGENSNV